MTIQRKCCRELHHCRFFARQRMNSRRTADVSVKGGASDEHRQTTVSKKERDAPRWRLSTETTQVTGPSRQSRQEARIGRVHVHPCCRLRPERLSPRIRPQSAARALVGERAHQHRAEAAGLRPGPPIQGRAECGWVGSRFRVFEPVKIQQAFHEVCTVFPPRSPCLSW